MAAATLGVRHRADPRDAGLQHGAWGLKTAGWVLALVLAFLLPVGAVGAYGWLARVGSGLFLCVQAREEEGGGNGAWWSWRGPAPPAQTPNPDLTTSNFPVSFSCQILMLIDFVCEWNDAWVDAGDDRLLWGLLAASGGAYAGAAAFVGVSLYFFNPASAGDCSFNVGVVTCACLAGLGVTGLALSGVAPRGSLFPASAVSLYVCYLAYSALVSEPHDYPCNALGRRMDAASAGALAVGVCLALASVAYTALRAGSNTSLLGLGPEAEVEDSPRGGAPLLPAAGELTSAGLDGGVGDVAGARAVGGGAALGAPRAIDDYQPVREKTGRGGKRERGGGAPSTRRVRPHTTNLHPNPEHPKQTPSFKGLLLVRLFPHHLCLGLHVHRHADDRVGHGGRGEGAGRRWVGERRRETGHRRPGGGDIRLGPGGPRGLSRPL